MARRSAHVEGLFFFLFSLGTYTHIHVNASDQYCEADSRIQPLLTCSFFARSFLRGTVCQDVNINIESIYIYIGSIIVLVLFFPPDRRLCYIGLVDGSYFLSWGRREVGRSARRLDKSDGVCSWVPCI